jgi:DNA ligase-1
MLAASKPKDYTVEMFYAALRWPVIGTPKLDGIRCVTLDLPRPPGYLSEPVCRSLKPVPNWYTASVVGKSCEPGLDGELMTYTEDLFEVPKMRGFNQIQSDIMTERGEPAFRYHVFDWNIGSTMPYEKRIAVLDGMKFPSCVTIVPWRLINNLDELLAYEAEQIALGYEGICFRDPRGGYKHGRSTLKEGTLIKMKRFIDDEATVIGMEEEMANNNPSASNELGYAERSSHGANMVGKGRMGALVVDWQGKQLKIGTGFTAQQRQNMWDTRDTVVGKQAKFKYQPHGMKDVPRIPVFIGFRSHYDS